MPIVRFICRGCGGREVSLDHFATTVCGQRVLPADYATAVLADRSSQYVTGKVRVSHSKGCVRAGAIEHYEPYAVDPADLNAQMTGVAWHALMEKAAPEGEVEVEVRGVINGIMINGKIDRIDRANNLLMDWKHSNDFGARYLGESMKMEHLIQLSLYAELVEQTFGWRPERGLIWHHYSVGGKGAMFPRMAKLMSLAEVLKSDPMGSGVTVAQSLAMADKVYKGEISWRDLPLTGQHINFGSGGKTACSYCAVSYICQEEAEESFDG